jgi:hypothetical protein
MATERPLPPSIEVDILSDLRLQLPEHIASLLEFEAALRPCAEVAAFARASLVSHRILQGRCSFSTEGEHILFPAQLRMAIASSSRAIAAAACVSIGAALALHDPALQKCTVRLSRIECFERGPSGILGWQWNYAVTVEAK